MFGNVSDNSYTTNEPQNETNYRPMEDTKITVQEAIENAGYNDIVDVQKESLFGSSWGVPATCSHGCMVEPDGTCPHGQESVLIKEALI